MGRLLVALALLGFLASGASAQTTVSTTDAAGDATLQGAPAGFLDLLAANATLDAGNLTVLVQLADAEAAVAPAIATAFLDHEYWIALRYRGEVFHAVVSPGLGQFPGPPGSPPSDNTEGDLYRALPGGDPPWTLVASADGRYDAEAGSLSASFPLTALAASDGFVPGPGEPIEVDAAVARFSEGPSSSHRAPSGSNAGALAGGDEAPFPPGSRLLVPGAVTANLALSTPLPIRFSNGEATTYHWPVSVVNRGTVALDATMAAAGDDQTVLRVPDRVQVPAGEARTVDLFATVPFTHIHGGSRAVDLVVRAGAEQAAMRLEVRYLPVPQPSGHHPLLFLHSGYDGSPQTTWLDTLEEPERPHDARMAFGPGGCVPPGATAGVVASGDAYVLDPPLAIGLAARAGEAARFEGVLDVGSVLAPSRLLARLALYNPLDFNATHGVFLEQDAATAVLPVPLTTQPGQIPFALDVPVPPEMRALPPGTGLNVVLHVVLCPDNSPGFVDPNSMASVSDFGPAILAGATVLLPLDEFHDTIPYSAANGPRLSVDEPDLRVRPGGKALWSVRVDGEAGRYEAELFGAAADLAVLHAAEARPGETVAVSLAVPADAKPGDFYEAIVSVHAGDDRLAASAIRLTATVDPAAGDASADVARLAPPGKESPGPTLLALLAALSLALVRLRRR